MKVGWKRMGRRRRLCSVLTRWRPARGRWVDCCSHTGDATHRAAHHGKEARQRRSEVGRSLRREHELGVQMA
ncbi:putative proline-rich receptor-like protein kinase PERK8 [Iris pallida]|uniref:Proline-rich receptor-like protein kinase PERK8 n=1 Tax=Iris pallida TaxID=29817 RepID=A0AAX6GUE9_IRIPA|nr:putative proline-rich receptor-like protein kinase PERK8 [Iris pallida]